jgi:hypothetical protein
MQFTWELHFAQLTFIDSTKPTKFIEAVESSKFNWGKFMVCQFTPEEMARRSEIDSARLIQARGWGPSHFLVVDLQTGEGAMFPVRSNGLVSHDLNMSHQIWVCPMFEPFLEWLYKQDMSDIDKLPGLVNLGEVETALRGYRRQRAESDTA